MKFKVCVGRRVYETVEIEVEAETQEAAEEQAHIEAEENTEQSEWFECDFEQFIVECEEVE